jgi:hypothetical protein
MPFAIEEFQVFHFGVIIKLFSSFFYHVQTLFYFFHCALFLNLLSTLGSYGVKANEHE